MVEVTIKLDGTISKPETKASVKTKILQALEQEVDKAFTHSGGVHPDEEPNYCKQQYTKQCN